MNEKELPIEGLMKFEKISVDSLKEFNKEFEKLELKNCDKKISNISAIIIFFK